MSAQAPPQAARRWEVEELTLRIESAGDDRYTVRVTGSGYGSQPAAIGSFTCSNEEAERLTLAVAAAVDAGLGRAPAATPPARDLVHASETVAGPLHAERDPAAGGGSGVDAGSALTPAAVGDRLFQWLLAGGIRDIFMKCLAGVERADRRLRLRIQIDPSLRAVAALPWEVLRQPETADFLARRPPTLLVRYADAPRLQAREPVLSAVRILVVRAQPCGTQPLALAEESRRLEAAWKQRSGVEIEVLDRPTRLALLARLNARTFNVLHFMGHGDFAPGSGEGRLLFEDEARRPDPFGGAQFADTLCGNPALRLVVLNACNTAQLPRWCGRDPFSSVAGALVEAGIPAVIAMQFPISDDAAQVFSQALYGALADGIPVDVAVAEARRAMRIAMPPWSWEWVTPALYMSAPDGQLLDPAMAAATAAGIASTAVGIAAVDTLATASAAGAASAVLAAGNAPGPAGPKAAGTATPTGVAGEVATPGRPATAATALVTGSAGSSSAPIVAGGSNVHAAVPVVAAGAFTAGAAAAPGRPGPVERTGSASRSRRATWLGFCLAVAAVLALGSLRLCHPAAKGPPAPATSPVPDGRPRVTAADAAQYVGKEAAVCGRVADVKYRPDVNSQPTFFDFEKPFPDEPFRAVVFGKLRDRLRQPPETFYRHGNFCVVGLVESYGGKPEIVVLDPAQLTADPE